MQYIVNGSFSGAYLEGYSYGGNYNVAKQEDGTYVFASSAATKDDGTGARGYLKPDVSKLVAGTEYTLSFDYRSGGSQAGSVFYGNGWGDAEENLKDICTLTQATIASWTHKEVKFTATRGSVGRRTSETSRSKTRRATNLSKIKRLLRPTRYWAKTNFRTVRLKAT